MLDWGWCLNPDSTHQGCGVVVRVSRQGRFCVYPEPPKNCPKPRATRPRTPQNAPKMGNSGAALVGRMDILDALLRTANLFLASCEALPETTTPHPTRARM